MMALSAAACATAALSACASEGELVINEGVGITSVLSLCPAIGIPDYTGDITTFRDPADRSLASLDVSAAMTNLRAQCNETGDRIYSEASFTVNARRSDTRGARTVSLPYFVAPMPPCRPTSARRSPRSDDRAMPMRRSIRWLTPKSRRRSPAAASRCWWASS
jgi:hypothetical protein